MLPAPPIMTEALGLLRARTERLALWDAEGWRLDGAEGGLDVDFERAPEGLRALLWR